MSNPRPSRRVAARRQKIVESDEEEDEIQQTPVKDDDDEEEFTPAAAPTPRRQSRRISRVAVTTVPPASPAVGRGRRIRSGENEAPATGSKQTAAAKPARSGRPRISDTPSATNSEESSVAPTPQRPPPPELELEPQVLTPSPSPAPAATPKASSPLSDITNSEEMTNQVSSQTSKIHSPIVIKSRTNALLQQQPPQEDTGPKPRLVITHLVLVNFKSYAGRQEVGPFHASFSSVVGPNGSGKSNVIDSLLFVFGFRASKMRQGKISALIHNSAAFPNLDYCEVEVHFQQVIDLPQGGSESIQDTKLVISRRAFKNNASKYYINGRNSDYTEVTTLLKDRGIDLDHKRFLILQGEVESIAQMKPKAQNEHDDGLLEYLEDIIGTSKYKQPIEETANQVEEQNEVCVEKSSRVQHVEKEKNSLEDKKNVAIEYIKNENALALKKSALYQVHIAGSERNIKITSEMMMQLQAEIDADAENHRGAEDGIKKLQKKHDRGIQETDDIEQEYKATLREVARYDKETVKFQEKEKFYTQKQKKLQKTIATNKHSASEARSLIERYSGDRERYEQEAAELTERLEAEETELAKIRDSLTHITQPFQDQIDIKKKSLEPWMAKVNDKIREKEVAQSELDLLLEKVNATQKARDEVVQRKETLLEAYNAKKEELQQCQVERQRLEKEATKLNAQRQKLSQQEPQIQTNLSSARQKADEAKSSLLAARTQGDVLSGLMRLKESGRIEGFHGRLGNLGTIDSKYDVAISTACPALDNMVVDTVDAGQQCIEYLRKNNLGRANFVCLNKLPSRDLAPIKTPENAPRLFDLIKPKVPVLAPAFYSVVQNTLVATDMEQANRIAYGAQRWRVVTLDGQLIDKSGTMTGGGTTVSKGRMSSKLVAGTTKEALAKLEKDRDTMELTFAEFQQAQQELDSKIRDVNEELPAIGVTISKIELELESAKKHGADLQKRLTELENGQGSVSTADKNRMAQLEHTVQSVEQELEQLNAETEGIEAEISVLSDKIMQAGGMKLRGQKSKVDGIKEQLELLNEQISAAGVSMKKAENQRAKSGRILAEAEEEIESISIELEGLKEDMKEHQNNAAESKAKAQERENELEAKKDELNALKEELDELTAELNKTRATRIELENKMEGYQKALSDNQKLAKHWQTELNKLTLQNISDLEGRPEGEAAEDEDEVTPPELPVYTEDELEDIDKDALKAQIVVLEEKVQNVNVDLSVLADYRRRAEEHAARRADLDEAVASRDSLKQRLDDFRKRRLEEFMEGFNIISLRLKEMYQMITMGGNAELELVDSLDPFSEGILFSVMPPKKSWKNISNLSGGEKTLSSLALVFALHHYKPTPLYVMDEIDAALDFRNVSIVASYIKERTKNAQFIVISLRNNMFELAARLVGVYKVNHMTKSVTIENRDYITTGAQA